MTHDELLAKIDIWKFQTKGYDDTYEVHGILNALRAVVEQTKPRAYKNEVDEMYIKGWNAAMERVIQVIKKELG